MEHRIPETVCVREMGGAPRNPAPRNRFLVRIVKPSGCRCTDACGGTNIVECRPLLGALPLSLRPGTAATSARRRGAWGAAAMRIYVSICQHNLH